MEQIIAASKNRHKLKEMEEILAPFGLTLISRDEAGVPDVEIEEDGETFEENSLKKAEGIMALCGRATVADDSGLAVEYLGGAPGVYSARFAGPECSDEKNIAKLLHLLEGVPTAERQAKFVCVITMAFPDGRRIVARGECPGRIIEEPVGEGGFGYDPVFVPEGYDKSFAQLSPEQKNRISHRGQALQSLARQLAAYRQEKG